MLKIALSLIVGIVGIVITINLLDIEPKDGLLPVVSIAFFSVIEMAIWCRGK